MRRLRRSILTSVDVNKKILYTLAHIRGSSKGRTAAFEAVNLGSIPSPRANTKQLISSCFVYTRTNGSYFFTTFIAKLFFAKTLPVFLF